MSAAFDYAEPAGKTLRFEMSEWATYRSGAAQKLPRYLGWLALVAILVTALGVVVPVVSGYRGFALMLPVGLALWWSAGRLVTFHRRRMGAA